MIAMLPDGTFKPYGDSLPVLSWRRWDHRSADWQRAEHAYPRQGLHGVRIAHNFDERTDGP